MRRVFSLLIILLIAVGIGLFLHRNPGMVVITIEGWRIDLPLWLAVMSILFFYLTLHYLVVFFSWCAHGIAALGQMTERYRQKRAKAQTEAGFKALTLGDYHEASRLLHKGASLSELPWVNYLFAAKAAQAEKDYHERDVCLAKAAACLPKNDAMIKMTACEFALQEGDWDKTLSLLQDLEKQLPDHPHVVELLKDVYLYQENWEQLHALLPKIKRAHLLSHEAFDQLESKIWHGLLQTATKERSDHLDALWKQIPPYLQAQPDLIKRYVTGLVDQGKTQAAEKILHRALDKNWDESLIKYYGEIEPLHPKKTLSILEKWLKTHADSPNLLSQLGRLSDQCDEWEKAQRYYEASLRLAPTPENYAALGAHWEKLNRADLGEAYFKKALALSLPEVQDR